MSSVEAGQMSAVETGQMTAAETSVLSQQKTVKKHRVFATSMLDRSLSLKCHGAANSYGSVNTHELKT